MFDRLLIPLTGEPFAEAALQVAERLPGSHIYLLRVALDTPAPPAGRLRPGFGTEDAYLERIASTLRTDAREVEVLQSWGDPASRAVEAAAGVDCIVMATHGRGGTDRIIRGSVADHVVRHALAPVLLVPGTVPAAPQLARIVVPLDGSLLAETVLPDAVDLARYLEVPLHLIRVTANPNPDARRYLEAVVERYAGAIDATATVRTGEVIRELAGAIDPRDLVVMATHGRHGLRRLVLGSVTDALVQTARAPILLVRPGPPRG